MTDTLSAHFPVTRFMGSKRKLLPFIGEAVKDLEYETMLDAFSGSGCVSYFFKSLGKSVTANDYLAYSSLIAQATVENNHVTLSDADLEALLAAPNPTRKTFVQDTFNGLYFNPSDNAFLDNTWANVRAVHDPYKRALALAALGRAAMKRQPRGVFTVTGSRYDDGRKDLRLSMREQFVRSVQEFNAAVFDNGRENHAYNQDIFNLEPAHYDLVYVDPPYYSPHSDNDYIRRYHFVEGLATYWEGVTIRENSRTRRIEKRDTPFASRERCYDALDRLFARYPSSNLLISYSSNSLPTKDEMFAMLRRHRGHVEVFELPHRYSFGNHGHKVGDNHNLVQEYLFLSRPS